MWKDTHIFVHDCDKKVNAAHPFKPEQIGQDLTSIKDTDGKSLLSDPHPLNPFVSVFYKNRGGARFFPVIPSAAIENSDSCFAISLLPISKSERLNDVS